MGSAQQQPRRRFFPFGPADAVLELNKIAVEKHYLKGLTLFTAGELPPSLFLLHSGRIRLFLPVDTQGSLSWQIIKPGGLLGLSETVSGKPHEFTARAELSSEVLFFPREAFLEIVSRHPAFWLSISSCISEQVEAAYERVRVKRSHATGNRTRKIKKVLWVRSRLS